MDADARVVNPQSFVDLEHQKPCVNMPGIIDVKSVKLTIIKDPKTIKPRVTCFLVAMNNKTKKIQQLDEAMWYIRAGINIDYHRNRVIPSLKKLQGNIKLHHAWKVNGQELTARDCIYVDYTNTDFSYKWKAEREFSREEGVARNWHS